MPNRTIKGFRFVRGESQSGTPQIEEGVVASAYGTAIYEGSCVRKVDDGTFEVAAAGATIYGVVASINQYYDSNTGRVEKSRRASPKSLPASTTYTGVDRESRIGVIPVRGNVFEVDGNTAVVAATLAGARALIGSNGDHVISSDDTALNTSDVEAKDASPASAGWTVIDIAGTDQDFTASRVKFLVVCNEPQLVASSTGL
jgi:hypothetical protein